MKKRIFVSVAVAFTLLASVSAYAVTPGASTVSPVAKQASVQANIDSTAVLKSRFLNMLNHSAAYGEDLESVEALANNAATLLLDMRDKADEDFISETPVIDYLYNMYGVEVETLSDINSAFPKKSGCIYIIPCGYTLYKHNEISVSINEDGSYTAVTNVLVDGHDQSYTATCVSLFTENENSAFGYNIISSEIYSDVSSM